MTEADDELENALKAVDDAIKHAEKIKKKRREDDLEKVKKLCKTHGFTATQLRGFLKVKGKDEPVKKTRKPRTPKAAIN
jgi:flagellar biosynthesis/type III secretory pathway protein FliH